MAGRECQVERGPEAGSRGSREAWHVQSSTTGTWTLQKVWQKWDQRLPEDVQIGIGGKKNIKNTKKNRVFVRSSWKIYRFFFHVFCCNSTSLVAGWLAEIELEDPVCLTNGLAVLDTHIFLQGERVLRAGNMQRKLGDIIWCHALRHLDTATQSEPFNQRYLQRRSNSLCPPWDTSCSWLKRDDLMRSVAARGTRPTWIGMVKGFLDDLPGFLMRNRNRILPHTHIYIYV